MTKQKFKNFYLLTFLGERTPQMSWERVLLTKAAKDCMREYNKLSIAIRLPKVSVTVGNKDYP